MNNHRQASSASSKSTHSLVGPFVTGILLTILLGGLLVGSEVEGGSSQQGLAEEQSTTSLLFSLVCLLGHFLLAVSALNFLALWGRAWKLYGRKMFHYGQQTRWLYNQAVIKADSGWLANACISLVGLILLGAFYFRWIPALHLLSFPVAFLLALFTANWVPPGAIFLSTSSPGSISLLGTLRQHFFGTRIVALFDRTQAEYRSDAQLIFHDNWRTEKVDWKKVVDTLCGFVRVIIADTRTETEAVHHEMLEVFQKGRTSKTIFLIGPDGECPALRLAVEVLSLPESERIHAVREKELTEAMQRLFALQPDLQESKGFDFLVSIRDLLHATNSSLEKTS